MDRPHYVNSSLGVYYIEVRFTIISLEPIEENIVSISPPPPHPPTHTSTCRNVMMIKVCFRFVKSNDVALVTHDIGHL